MNENTLGSTTPEFRQKVEDKLNDWFGGTKVIPTYTILFQWFDDTIAYVCVRTKATKGRDEDSVTCLYFLRLFEVGGKLVLSQDRKIEERISNRTWY